MPRHLDPQAALEHEVLPESDPRSSKRWSSADRMASLGRLAAGVAHEINNPLAYVLGSIELLERGLAEIGALHPEAARKSSTMPPRRYRTPKTAWSAFVTSSKT
jgi:signal transduction histidine kinase